MRILYFVREFHPTFRVDVAVLFGKYLPRLGVQSDLVTTVEDGPSIPWGGGQVFGATAAAGRIRRHLQSLSNDFSGLLKLRDGYDVIIVRDKPAFALFAWIASKLFRVPFGYWMSFPMPDEWLDFARERRSSLGFVRWAVVYLRGWFSYWALYKVVLPQADVAFLQSDAMVKDLRGRGVQMKHAVAVPMGVDHEAVDRSAAVLDERAAGWVTLMQQRETIVYLGTLERNRRLEIALHAFDRVRRSRPEALLALVGDAHEPDDVELLKDLTAKLGLSEHVIFTGWMSIAAAWTLVRAARVGFSPFPRGPIHETASPTKTVEYLALGLPVVANDQPDQAWVLQQSGGGLCTKLEADDLAQAMVQMLGDPEAARRYGEAGRVWVLANRSYERLASLVHAALRKHVSV